MLKKGGGRLLRDPRPILFTVWGIGLLLPSPLGAWGAVGHQTLAFIAQDYLTPAARQAIGGILEPGEDLASVSAWADSIVEARPETAPWHYIRIDVREVQNRYDLQDACRDHACVVDQVRKDLGVLRRPLASRRDKREALEFLTHFVGDLHQPLHCAEDRDRGGNEKWLRYYGSRGNSRRFTWVNLHRFWDNLLEPGANADPRRLASRLEWKISARDRAEWERGGPVDWAYESYWIARKDIYSELPEGPLPEKNRWGRDLPADYYSGRMWGIARLQLEKAGIRLAYLLNGLFDKNN